MSSRDDGGPALPVQDGSLLIEDGMTLRDWFAGQAMNGLVHHAFVHLSDPTTDEAMTEDAMRVLKDVGEASYRIADSMIKARED